MTTFLFIVGGWFLFAAFLGWGFSRYFRWLDSQEPYDWSESEDFELEEVA